MSLALGIDELLGHTNGERGKWEQWFAAQPPAALDAPLQRDGRFPTVWRLMGHIFLVEKRHTQRLKREHILFHEIRHWAQIAAALRNAGSIPPGDHDLLFSGAME